MGKAIDLKLLFQGLISQFGFGKISAFKATNIIKRIPKYSNVKIKDADLSQRALYSGRYTGYSDDELLEVLKTELLQKEIQNVVSYPSLYRARESSLYQGKLVHFRELDKRLDLPPGTARRLLITVAAEYGLEPELVKDNIVRFRATERFKKDYMQNG